MRNYLDLLEEVLVHGVTKENRTGVDVASLFGQHLRFNLQDGFPLVTTKKVHFKSIAHELLFFISGNTNIKYLNDNGVTIWDEWADESGDLGPVYGKQWRNWEGYIGNDIDQLADVINEIKTTPDSRRMIVNAWNVGDIVDMRLPPCHLLYQFNVTRGRLSCSVYQRSVDCFLGLPFNIASYALLTHMVAQVCELEVGDLIFSMGDTHIYSNHFSQVLTQLDREPKPLCQLHLDARVKDIDDFTYDDILLMGRVDWPAIKAEVAV